MTLPTESVKQVTIDISKHIPEGAKITSFSYSGDASCVGFDQIKSIIIQYAEAEPLVAKELWGHKPTIWEHGMTGKYYAFYEYLDWNIATPDVDTEAEAIAAWNQFRDKVEGER